MTSSSLSFFSRLLTLILCSLTCCSCIFSRSSKICRVKNPVFLQANDARKEVLEKERETQRLKQEVTGLKQALKEANDQCVLLYNEVQRAWRVSFTLQSDLKVLQC